MVCYWNWNEKLKCERLLKCKGVDYRERFNETRHQKGSLCTRSPELRTNLFSTSAATRLGWEVIFSSTSVRISSAKHEVIMVGERAGKGLVYLLMIHPRPIHVDHKKQLGFSCLIKTGVQDYQVNFALLLYSTK